MKVTEEELKRLFPHEVDEVYLLIAIARKKYNPQIRSVDDNAKGNAVVRMVVRHPDDWGRKLARMKAVVNNYTRGFIKPDDFNFYASINPRDVNKAYKMMKERFADWDYDNAKAHINRIDAEWVSCLQNKSCRSRKQYFMLDIDVKDPKGLEKIKLTLPEGVYVDEIETRGGYHILLKPFNVYEWGNKHKKMLKEYNVEIMKDRLIYLGRGHNPKGKYPLKTIIRAGVLE